MLYFSDSVLRWLGQAGRKLCGQSVREPEIPWLTVCRSRTVAGWVADLSIPENAVNKNNQVN